MPDTPKPLVEKYEIFYEVSPYNLLTEKQHGSPTATSHMIQAGFDVDVHGLSNKAELELPPSADYALGYALLKKIADVVSEQASECFLEVITFPSTIWGEACRHFRPEAVIRIRISCRATDQPAGLAEQRALEKLEEQLRSLGIRRL